MVNPGQPVGVFDSGVGGLSVLREIRRELPGEHLIYVADSAHAPYGDRTKDFIEERATTLVEFLIGQRAKAIVVACNTATGMAVEALRARFALPIVAIEPALKPASTQTRSGVVGVLATKATLASPKFQRLLEDHAANVTVVTQAGVGLATQVEKGDLTGPATRALVEQHVRPLVDRGADTIVLGCTHYPFIGDLIREAAGPDVNVIDPAVAVARELRRRLQANGLLSPTSSGGTERFFTSGALQDVQAVISQLWAHPVSVDQLPDDA